jgi:predicted N-formylglutamate amidohydrolase
VVTGLLQAAEPAPVAVIPAGGPLTRAVLCCDHASRRIPRALGDLGLGAADLERHIAWDIGAAALTEQLARLLAAPACLAAYSRLVIDCNRHPDDPTLIPVSSDGTPVGGNAGLTPGARRQRLEALFEPYHAAVAAALTAAGSGAVPVLIAIHSFTPILAGQRRPWDVGVLWDTDARLAAPLLAALRAVPGICVGDNQPYSGRAPTGYTTGWHGGRRGLPHVAIEVRQDLLATDEGVGRWARLLTAVLAPILRAA